MDTLLDTFKAHETANDGDWVRVESDLLAGMNTARPTEMEFHEASFLLINVAMMDNLAITEQIDEKLIVTPCEDEQTRCVFKIVKK